jgi:hypothetical protein
MNVSKILGADLMVFKALFCHFYVVYLDQQLWKHFAGVDFSVIIFQLKWLN